MKNPIQHFSTVASLAGSVVVTANAQQAVQWRVEDGGNGHWYRLVPEAWNWTSARDRAESLGGHLATLTSQGEANFVIPLGSAHAWLGGSTPPNQGCNLSAWSWVTGEPWSFAFWAGGEPGSCSETALAFASWGGYSGRWNNNHPTVVPTGFLVEWSADCNNDGVIDYGQILSGQLADSNNDGIPNICECPCDVFGDNAVNGIDLGILLGQWGPVNQYTVTDFNGDGAVDGSDLGTLLAAWGPCPG